MAFQLTKEERAAQDAANEAARAKFNVLSHEEKRAYLKEIGILGPDGRREEASPKSTEH